MLQWLSNIGNWLVDTFSPLITFFKSVVHGLWTLIQLFPKIFTFVTQAIGYIPSIFAVFVTITVIVYVVYLIIGRDAGDA